ncbi:MAG: YkgJ family cysteine cluster protein [Deltaproteobacteria bacterium]|nr:YkgJ family cysteine cluster protein [Deltaproteobacteria bacterium]
MSTKSSPDPLAPAFDCLRCGDCCTGEGGIFFRPDEVGPAAGYLGLTEDEFLARFCRPLEGLWEILADERGLCSLVGPAGCRIHPVKPRVCRAWPFLPNIVADPGAFEEAKLCCPGIKPAASHAQFQAQAALEDPGPIPHALKRS